MANYVPSSDSHDRPFGAAHVLCSLLLALASSAMGCAEEDPGPGPIPLDELRQELTQATCNQYVRCGEMPDQATCEAVQGDGRLTLQLLTDAVLGRVTYDEAAARACVEATRTRACNNLQSTQKALLDACANMFVGTIPEGSACLFPDECAGGGTCDISMCMGGGVCCLGTCVKPPAPVALGGDCTTNPCVESAYCDASTMPPTCKTRKDNGDACDAQGQCKDGMRCDVGGSLPTCYLLSDRNGACNPTLEAGSCTRYDDYCHPTDRKCTALPGDGQPCTEDGQCQDYAHCDAGMCKKRPVEAGTCSDVIDCLGTLECATMVCTLNPSTEVCAF